MKTFYEKEKKLNEVIKKLSSLEFQSPKLISEIEILDNQKNQLEIEKKDLEERYGHLRKEYERLKSKLLEENLEKKEVLKRH